MVQIRLQMDVTNRESIAAGKKIVEENDGRLHILVNKFVAVDFDFSSPSFKPIYITVLVKLDPHRHS
jgi:hypothetical protein